MAGYTTLADPNFAVRDRQLLSVILRAALTSLKNPTSSANYLFTQLRVAFSLSSKEKLLSQDLIDQLLDPNDWRVAQARPEGMFMIPWRSKMAGVLVPATISEIERQYPNKLTVKTHAFVTQVLFESKNA